MEQNLKRSVEAVIASLGCGNPLAGVELRPGEVVLDLGSGDAADAVARSGVPGVEFHTAGLDAITLDDVTVDLVISDCDVNLTPDNGDALGEVYRVLRPGGRLSVSDIVTREPVPDELRNAQGPLAESMGAVLSEQEYRDRLIAAGFTDIELIRVHEYTRAEAEAAGVLGVLEDAGLDTALRLGFASTSIRAVKPARAR